MLCITHCNAEGKRGDWSLDLDKWAKGKKKGLQKARKKIAFKLYNNITLKTPVDTGRARGNWFVDTVDDMSKVDEQATTRQVNGEQDMPDVKGDESIYIYNNLPYIRRLEFGWSKRSPDGMVGVTLANSEKYVHEALQEVGVIK